jgi:hypothetical protein
MMMTTDLVRQIVHLGYQDAIQSRALIEVLQYQNENGVNDEINARRIAEAGISSRNAMLAQVTMLVSRAYAPRGGDLHLAQAFFVNEE